MRLRGIFVYVFCHALRGLQGILYLFNSFHLMHLHCRFLIMKQDACWRRGKEGIVSNGQSEERTSSIEARRLSELGMFSSKTDMQRSICARCTSKSSSNACVKRV